MRMPESQPENYKAIYDYYAEFKPNQRIQNLGFAAMHATYNSDVHYRPGAESIIIDHLESGCSGILVPNHQSNADTPTVAGLVYEQAFSKFRGTTIIPAKAEMFDWPLVGRFIPHMQAHPTFRSRDFAKTEEGRLLKDSATDRLIRLNIDHINNGGNVAIFAESTRNKDSPQEVQSLRSGLGRIALGVDDQSRVKVIPLGIAYKSKKLKRRPVVVVAASFSPEGMTQDEILLETHERMQSATSEAFERAA